MPEPTDAQWRDLYSAFEDFCRMEPWRWLSDADVVAIKHPSGEEIGYCAVLGNAGFEYGLGVYVGDEGLASYLALATDEVEPESDAALETTHALSAILADREDLYAMDRATIRRLGIRYRGRGGWPLFLSTHPGHVPWRLDADESIFLTTALRNMADVALRVASGELSLYTGREPGSMLTRVFRDGAWQDEWGMFRLPQPPAPIPDYPDSEKLRRLAQSKHREPMAWEVGIFLLHTPIQEKKDERPFFPTMSLVVDSASSHILSMKILGAAPSPLELQEALVEQLDTLDMLPAELVVDSRRTASLVKSVANGLRIEVSEGATSALDDAKEAMAAFSDVD